MLGCGSRRYGYSAVAGYPYLRFLSAGHALSHPGLLELVVKNPAGVLEPSVTVEQGMGIRIGIHGLISRSHFISARYSLCLSSSISICAFSNSVRVVWSFFLAAHLIFQSHLTVVFPPAIQSLTILVRSSWVVSRPSFMQLPPPEYFLELESP